MKAEPPADVSASDLALLQRAAALAGNDGKLAALLGMRPSAITNYRTRGGLPRPVRLILKWYVQTARLEPPENMAELGLFYDFTARVAGHKQLRKVVLALADPWELPIFERAMKATMPEDEPSVSASDSSRSS